MNQNKNSSARSREEKDQYPDPKGREISGLGRMIHFFRFFRFCRCGFFPFYFLLLVCHLTFQDLAIFFYFKRIGPFVNLISFWRVEFPENSNSLQEGSQRMLFRPNPFLSAGGPSDPDRGFRYRCPGEAGQ